MTIASDLLQQHFQTLVNDNIRWQMLIDDNIVWNSHTRRPSATQLGSRGGRSGPSRHLVLGSREGFSLL